jgi:hypothetical protein
MVGVPLLANLCVSTDCRSRSSHHTMDFDNCAGAKRDAWPVPYANCFGSSAASRSAHDPIDMGVGSI